MIHLAAALVLLAQTATPTAAPLTDTQKKAASGMLDAFMADQTFELRPNKACPFELTISANPKKRDHDVRVTIRPATEDASELPETGKLALVRMDVDAYEKKIKKGKDDLLEFFPFESALDMTGEAELTIPYAKFVEWARPVPRNLLFVGIDGTRGSPCILEIEKTDAVREFHKKIQ